MMEERGWDMHQIKEREEERRIECEEQFQKDLQEKKDFEAFKKWQKRNPKRWRNVKKK